MEDVKVIHVSTRVKCCRADALRVSVLQTYTSLLRTPALQLLAGWSPAHPPQMCRYLQELPKEHEPFALYSANTPAGQLLAARNYCEQLSFFSGVAGRAPTICTCAPTPIRMSGYLPWPAANTHVHAFI